MNTALDIYIKLLVALVSFTTPVIVYLLSVFSDGILLTKNNALEEDEQIQKLSEVKFGLKELPQIQKGLKELKKKKRKNKRLLHRLNPKKQIIKIFVTLSLSLVFIAFYVLVKDHDLKIYNSWVAKLLFISSFVCFILAVWFLKIVAWTAIEVKQTTSINKSEDSFERIEKE